MHRSLRSTLWCDSIDEPINNTNPLLQAGVVGRHERGTPQRLCATRCAYVVASRSASAWSYRSVRDSPFGWQVGSFSRVRRAEGIKGSITFTLFRIATGVGTGGVWVDPPQATERDASLHRSFISLDSPKFLSTSLLITLAGPIISRTL